MSNVKVFQRKESGVQFLDTARELTVHLLGCVKRMPKSWRFVLTNKLADLGCDIYTEVCTANAIYPKAGEDIEQRARHLNVALGKIDALDGLATIAFDCIGTKNAPVDKADTTRMSDYAWYHLGELLDKERNLINKVLASDKKRLS